MSDQAQPDDSKQAPAAETPAVQPGQPPAPPAPAVPVEAPGPMPGTGGQPAPAPATGSQPVPAPATGNQPAPAAPQAPAALTEEEKAALDALCKQAFEYIDAFLTSVG